MNICENCKHWRRFHSLAEFGKCLVIASDPHFGHESAHASKHEYSTCEHFEPSPMKTQHTPTPGVIHAFASMPIEVGCLRRKRPSYRWTQGYSEVTETGTTNPVTRTSLRSKARRDGVRLVIHKSQREAREALTKVTP